MQPPPIGYQLGNQFQFSVAVACGCSTIPLLSLPWLDFSVELLGWKPWLYYFLATLFLIVSLNYGPYWPTKLLVVPLPSLQLPSSWMILPHWKYILGNFSKVSGIRCLFSLTLMVQPLSIGFCKSTSMKTRRALPQPRHFYRHRISSLFLLFY